MTIMNMMQGIHLRMAASWRVIENQFLQGLQWIKICSVHRQPYVVDDKIDLDDENVIDPQSELPCCFASMHAACQLAPIWCAKTFISGYIVLNDGVDSCLIWRN